MARSKKSKKTDFSRRMRHLLEQPHDPALWVGARRHLPNKDCDVCVWHDATTGEVRLAVYVPSFAPSEALALLLGDAMLAPLSGGPSRPRAIVVLSEDDLYEVRLMADMFGIEVLGDLDTAVSQRMLARLESLLDVEETGYLQSPHVSTRVVADMYEAAREFLWSRFDVREKIRMDIESLHVEVRLRDAPRGLDITYGTDEPVEITVRFHPAEEAGSALVDEAANYRFKHLDLYPVVSVAGLDGAPPQAEHHLAVTEVMRTLARCNGPGTVVSDDDTTVDVQW